MSIKIKLEGFDELIKQIENAGGTVDRAAESALQQSAQIMDNELRAQLNAATESALASKMPKPVIKKESGRYTAEVGFPYAPYHPNNPSDYHKAIFLNYGTPSRTKHGKERARGFVGKAKRRARPKIKKAQEEVLNKILSRLKR